MLFFAFLCSDFDVYCLCDVVGHEFVGKPMLDLIRRLHLGQPSEGIDQEVLFWFDSQLHVGLLFVRSRTSLLHVLQLCFMTLSFSKHSFKGFFPSRRLSADMHLCIGHFNPGGVAVVNARGMVAGAWVAA